jgi:hypothetical protein
MHRLLTLLTLLLTGLSAMPAEAGIWEDLAGHWIGTGEVRGMSAQIDLRFRMTLDGRGRHLEFRNHMHGADGTSWLFSAEALYLCPSEDKCTGHWYDSRGVVLPLAVTTLADRVVVDWGDGGTERGRTTYSLEDEGTLSVLDEVAGKDGEMRMFGRTLLSRKNTQ